MDEKNKVSKIRDFIKAKKFFIIPIVLIAVFLTVRFVLLSNPSTELTYKVVKEDLVDVVKASGNYNSSATTEVISPTNGVISEIYVGNNQSVKKGDKLFHVESTATENEQKKANADYLTTKTALDADTAKLYSLQSTMFSAWDTYKNLAENTTYKNDDGSPNNTNRALPEFTTAQDDWFAAEANYKNQQGVIAKDKAALSSAYLIYSQTQSTTVNAQANGIITNLLKKTGDEVRADKTKPILVISNPSNPYIMTSISEDYAARVKEGQSAEVIFDSLKTKSFKEKVEGIDSVGSENNGIVTYDVRITADGITSEIKPKMTAIINIETLKKANILTIPNSAIVSKDRKSYVVTAKNHKQIPIETGVQGIAKTEVISGLSEGDIILANPN